VKTARSSELTAVEGKIERLKREARQYEEKGAGREADNQAAVIGRVVGLKPALQRDTIYSALFTNALASHYLRKAPIVTDEVAFAAARRGHALEADRLDLRGRL
jgi:hypothetical protein